MAKSPNYYIVEADALPEIFRKVVEARRLMDTGEVETVNQAVQATGISRSAFYKYKDAVRPFQDMLHGRIVTFQLLLKDEPGLLSRVLNIFAGSGANILTINQGIPSNGCAVVTVNAETSDMGGSLQGLLEEIGGVIAREMEEFGVTWWLAPGMNIKRNPLCGRNFEYYSEDPLVAGKIAAAITRGVQAVPGAAVTIKHFACNNQEDNLRGAASIVSERALREIYLKGFEIAVREAQPHAIMTSYNKINGVHTANSRDLCTVAAREEWGFQGLIMTDWTTTNFEGGSSAAKCVAAGNDLTMPGLESDIREIIGAVKEENDQSLDIKDLDACCARILGLIRKLCC